MKSLKSTLFFFGIFSILSFIPISTGNIDNLNVIFRGAYEEDYYVNPNPTSFNGGPSLGGDYYLPNENMKFVVLYLTLENIGDNACTFDFKDVYLSTMKDSLYPFYGTDGRAESKETIKPKKKIKRKIYFEFPKKDQPNELFIEDKRFKIMEDK